MDSFFDRNNKRGFYLAVLTVSAFLMQISMVAASAAVVQPVVSGLSVHKGTPFGGTPITVSGHGFRTGDKVMFGTVPAKKAVVVSYYIIKTISPPSASSGVVDVRVVAIGITRAVSAITPKSSRATSSTLVPIGITRAVSAITPADRFTYYKFVSVTNAPGNISSRTPPRRPFFRPPTITKVNPRYGPPQGGTQLTITGSGFVDGATEVVFNLDTSISTTNGQRSPNCPQTITLIPANIIFINNNTIQLYTYPAGAPAQSLPTACPYMLSITTPGGTSIETDKIISDEFLYWTPPSSGSGGTSPSSAVVAPFTCKPNPLVVKPWATWEAVSIGVALKSLNGIPLETPHPVTCSDNNKPYASAISSINWNWGDGTSSPGVSGGNVQHLYFNTDNIVPGTGVMNKSYPISETITLKDGNIATLSKNVTVATAYKDISSITLITVLGVLGTQPCPQGTIMLIPYATPIGSEMLCGAAPGINPTPEDGILIKFDIANMGYTQSSKPGKIVIKVKGTTVFTFYPMFYENGVVPLAACPNPPKFPNYTMNYYGNTSSTTGIPESIYCFLNTGLEPNAPYLVEFLLSPSDFPNNANAYPDSWLTPSGLNNGLSVLNDVNVEYGGCHLSCGLLPILYSIGRYYSSAYYAPVAGFSFDIGNH